MQKFILKSNTFCKTLCITYIHTHYTNIYTYIAHIHICYIHNTYKLYIYKYKLYINICTYKL